MLNRTKLLSLILALPILFGLSFNTNTANGQQTKTKQVKVDVHIHVDGKRVGAPAVNDEARAPIDVAILLDTSGSMGGLISQAKTQLWKIVQKFSTTEKNGMLPKLRVSVFEYGNSNLMASDNYIRQVLPLCDDLDKVSEALFALTISGGEEYCGAAIGDAVKRLDWSSRADAYKAIFIAGNEPFTQGPSDYKETCSKSIQSGIVVNTIHCGDHSTGVHGMWADGARIGEGKSLNIDQDVRTVHIPCPQDKIIIELNTKLNSTYLWYGKQNERLALATNQAVQDSNAMQMSAGSGAGPGMGGGLGGGGGSLGGRAGAKVSGLYKFHGKDLVDSLEVDENVLEGVEEDALPEEMQKMDATQRQAFLEQKADERVAIQNEIKKLTIEREKFLASEDAKKAGEASGASFGDAMIDAVTDQLFERGFKLNEK